MRIATGIIGLCVWASVGVAIRDSRAADPKAPLGSVGYYSKGSLDGGVAMPEEGDHHFLMFPARCYAMPRFAAIYDDPDKRENSFGNAVVVQAILDVAAAVHAAHPDAPRLMVAEIANRHGGQIPYHLSHQNGLDADILFLQRGGGDARWPLATCTPYGELPRFEAIDPVTGKWRVTPDFELAWNWSLAASFAARKDVQAIFVGGLIKPALAEWAKAEGVPAAERRLTLAKLVPVTCTPPKGQKVPFYKNNWCPHDDHYHVRFKCPKGSPRCISRR